MVAHAIAPPTWAGAANPSFAAICPCDRVRTRGIDRGWHGGCKCPSTTRMRADAGAHPGTEAARAHRATARRPAVGNRSLRRSIFLQKELGTWKPASSSHPSNWRSQDPGTLVIIDTRDVDAYASGHIPGAVNLRDIFTYLPPRRPRAWLR